MAAAVWSKQQVRGRGRTAQLHPGAVGRMLGIGPKSITEVEDDMKASISAVLILIGAFAFGSPTLKAANMTLTGTVSDTHCGAKHPIADAAACTKACVSKGADYALVSEGKVYTLKADDAQKTELSNLAGKMATVMGDVKGNTVTVASVKMAGH
jgi:hypothetical protein